MKKTIKLLFLISIVFYSCDDLTYTKGVHKDSEKLFTAHKKFFKSLVVSGEISEKKYCDKCQINKYQIVINVKEKIPEIIELGYLSYQPYYFFNNKNQLIVSVTQYLYKSLNEGSFIEKKMDSDSLSCEKQQYILLSSKEYQWLPE